MADIPLPVEILPSAGVLAAIVAALIIASGFFFLFERAFGQCRKSLLQKKAHNGTESRGGKKYRRVLNALENPSRYHAAARIWVCVLRVLAVFLAACGIMRQPGAFNSDAGAVLAIAVSTLALAAAMLLLGEVPSKIIARRAPEQTAAALLPIVGFFALPLRPLYRLARRISALLRSVFPQESRRPGITEDELRLALMEGEKSGIVESAERTMVEGVFYLGDRTAEAFMTHRSEIQWLDVNASPEEIRAKAMEYRNQRCFPVADGTLDAIIGAAYLEDIILDLSGENPRGLRAIMKTAQFIPATMPALKAFESFKRSEANFLFVMDEYGGFAGIISVRDLVEEIVGELVTPQGEADTAVQQEDGSWLADGSLNIDEAAELLSLPGLADGHGGYHTLAGFVLSLSGELPRVGESFMYQNLRFTVLDMDGNRIDKLMIKREEG